MKYILLLFLLCGCAVVEHKTKETWRVSLSTANSLVGLHEKRNKAELSYLLGLDPSRYEWCAAFVNLILNLNGIPGSESVSNNPLVARSFLRWGTEVKTPKRGDVVVFPRGNNAWQGHVGFYYKTEFYNGIEYFIILGGNQSDSVTYERYPRSKALSIRRWIPTE
jgi:uncharacterized protein (TIGR02594 family)